MIKLTKAYNAVIDVPLIAPALVAVVALAAAYGGRPTHAGLKKAPEAQACPLEVTGTKTRYSRLELFSDSGKTAEWVSEQVTGKTEQGYEFVDIKTGLKVTVHNGRIRLTTTEDRNVAEAWMKEVYGKDSTLPTNAPPATPQSSPTPAARIVGTNEASGEI